MGGAPVNHDMGGFGGTEKLRYLEAREEMRELRGG